MDVKIEFYAGARADESPTWVTMDGRRCRVEKIVSRERVQTFSGLREVFVCRLDTGQVVRLERAGEGPWDARIMRMA